MKLKILFLITIFALSCGKDAEVLESRMNPDASKYGSVISTENQFGNNDLDQNPGDIETLPKFMAMGLQSRSGMEFSFSTKLIPAPEEVKLIYKQSGSPATLAAEIKIVDNKYVFLMTDQVPYGVTEFVLQIGNQIEIPLTVRKEDFFIAMPLYSSFNGNAENITPQISDGFEGWVNTMTPVLKLKDSNAKFGLGPIIH